MELFAILITNQITTYGGAQPLCQSVLFVFMGNPTTYKGNTFNWEQGRKLASGTMNGKEFSYRYDGNGMRYEKVVNEVKTQYYYNDTQLLMESKNGKRKWYIYGVTGIEGMIVEGEYQDSVYYFEKNTLGDVIAIRDEYGDVVARYTYDAWGNIIDQDGEMADANPFRYRGYYYDTETGFYYLQTRYYDPTICRFINADNYELVADLASVPGQLNMYAYCGNNPIMYTDETGEFLGAILLLWTVVEIALLATKTVEGSKVEGEVEIKNSHLIHTPWVQWGYSFYLNHIKSDTKDIIKGTTSGVQSEWAAHNLGYYGLSALKVGVSLFGGDTDWIVKYMGYAKTTNIGATVFDNPIGSDISKGLIAYNFMTNPIATLIDYYLVYKRG